MFKKTDEKGEELKNLQKEAYPSIFSIFGFLISVVFLVADAFLIKKHAAIIEVAALLIFLVFSKILEKAINANDEKAKYISEELSKLSRFASYISPFVCAASLIVACLTD